MNKILIWDYSFTLANMGGPAGYLYNLHEFLKLQKSDNIVFLSDLIGVSMSIESEKKRFSKIKKYMLLETGLARKIIELIKFIRFFVFGRDIIESFESKNINLNEYGYIHFHTLPDLRRSRYYLSLFKGKVILTTHSPEPFSCEFLGCCGHWNPIIYKVLLYSFLRFEIKVYKMADYFMFPCSEALEPYIKYRIYNLFFKEREDQIFYVPTGLHDAGEFYIGEHDDNFWDKYNIPQGAFVVCYMGRHNEVKGYDILKEIASHVIARYSDIYFVVGGKEEPLQGLKSKQWIELGWVNNANEIISKSDLFLLPNRETYFDLILLEVLRSGTVLLVSNTGGNKYFKRFCLESNVGLFFFEKENIVEAISCLEFVYNKYKISELSSLKSNNRRIWEEHFSIEQFVSLYLKSIAKLI